METIKKQIQNTILLILVIAFFVGCMPRSLYVVKIPAGKHRKTAIPRMTTSDKVSGVLYVTSSMIYEAANNGVSKICGFSDGINHHNNSARLGWICIDSVLWICSYCYADSQSPQENPYLKERLKIVYPGQTVNYVVERINDDYVFTVDEIHWQCRAGKKRWVGWFLKPYVGGTYTNDKVTEIKQNIN